MPTIVVDIPSTIFTSNFTKYSVNVIISFEGDGDRSSSMVDHHVDTLSPTNGTGSSLTASLSPSTANNPLSRVNPLFIDHTSESSSESNHPSLTNWSIQVNTNPTASEASGSVTRRLSDVSDISNSSNTAICGESNQQRSEHMVYSYCSSSTFGPGPLQPSPPPYSPEVEAARPNFRVSHPCYRSTHLLTYYLWLRLLIWRLRDGP
jgi:hypothetical protein